jgi:hypothetical protein
MWSWALRCHLFASAGQVGSFAAEAMSYRAPSNAVIADSTRATRRVLLDARPLQGADSQRGIGSYVRGLVVGLLEEGFDGHTALLFDASLPVPPIPAGDFVTCTVERRYQGRPGGSFR